MITQLMLLGSRYRMVVMICLAIITAMAAAGLPKLTVDTSFDSLIPIDDPARVVYQQVMEEFGSDNKTVIYVENANLWTPEVLRSVYELQRDIKGLPNVERVDSIYNLRTITGSAGSVRNDEPGAGAGPRRDGFGDNAQRKLDSFPILPGVPDTIDDALAAKTLALANPLFGETLFSQNGKVTAIVVTTVDPDDATNFSERMYLAIEDELEQHRSDFDRLFQVGPPRINAELRASLLRDFQLLGPLSAAVLVTAILIFMRSWLAAALPLATSALTIVWTFGLLGWLGVSLNTLSAMIPSLIIVIGSTEDTHIMAAFYRRLRTDPDAEPGPALVGLARQIGLPLVLTVVTTTLGFASNLFSDMGLIRDFAIASTFAMLANGIITILIAPMLLVWFGRRKDDSNGWDENTLPHRLIAFFRIAQDRAPSVTLAIAAALVVFFGYQASRLYVANDPLSYFQPTHPLIADFDRIHDELTSVRVFFITLDAGTERAFLEPRNIDRLVAVQRFVDEQGIFERSVSVADHLAFVNRELQGQFSELSLPETRELVAQYLLLFHRSDLEAYVNYDFSRANITVFHDVSDSHILNRYIGELEDAVGQIVGEGVSVSVVGENLMINQAAERLLLAQVQALGLLLVLIFLLMSVMFTSFKGGLIALVPTIIPIALVFGAMAMLGIPLNPGTAMVAVVAVGVAVDSTIHLLAKYNELSRQTSDYRSAVRAAVEQEATPMVISSFALALGFIVLMWSNFTVVAQFGALAAATMMFSVVANLLITPIIMARVRLVGLYQILSIRVNDEVLESSPLLRNMTSYQRRKAILISEQRDFAEGDFILRQGEVGRSMYLILEGQAEVIRRDGENQRVLATLQPGQFLGEVGYARAMERTADVVATSRMTALRFDYDRLQSDLKFFPNIVAKLNSNISAILGERLADVLSASDSTPQDDLTAGADQQPR